MAYYDTIKVLREIDPNAPEYQNTHKVWIDYTTGYTDTKETTFYSFETDAIACFHEYWDDNNIIVLTDRTFEVLYINPKEKQEYDIRLFEYFDRDNPYYDVHVKQMKKGWRKQKFPV